MKSYIRLNRSVMRGSTTCFDCNYPIVDYDELYRPTVDGVALFDACSERCSKRRITGEMVVAYA